LWYIINRMASIVESYRNILYGSIEGAPPGPPDIQFLIRTVVTSFAILAAGYLVFIGLSDRFSEEL
jgi:ABC-type polysaccharide/polyol phosphate export permease